MYYNSIYYSLITRSISRSVANEQMLYCTEFHLQRSVTCKLYVRVKLKAGYTFGNCKRPSYLGHVAVSQPYAQNNKPVESWAQLVIKVEKIPLS